MHTIKHLNVKSMMVVSSSKVSTRTSHQLQASPAPRARIYGQPRSPVALNHQYVDHISKSNLGVVHSSAKSNGMASDDVASLKAQLLQTVSR